VKHRSFAKSSSADLYGCGGPEQNSLTQRDASSFISLATTVNSLPAASPYPSMAIHSRGDTKCIGRPWTVRRDGQGFSGRNGGASFEVRDGTPGGAIECQKIKHRRFIGLN
jgi:hypothetical protein